MKFSSLPSFEKHLQDSSLCQSYLVITADADERGKILSQISAHLKKKHPQSEVISLSQKEYPFEALCAGLSTLPFFSSHVIIRLDDVGVFSKKEREQLEQFIKKPAHFAFLLMGCSSAKDLSSITSQAKEELVTLDLSQEKPWDKARRLKGWVQKRCFDEGKKISSALIDHLLDACSADVMLLERELAKILTYVADRKEITEQDVKSVGVHYSLPTGWQMAEQLVFEGSAGVKDPSFSLSDLLPLFGQLRYHLTNGRQVAFHRMVSATKEQISAHMPQLRSAMLDKYVALTSELGAPFFDRALEALFRVELLAKNSSFSAVFLWDYLSAQLSQIRSMYVRKR